MIAFLIRRLAVAFLTVLLGGLVVFLAVRLLPNNPVAIRFGQHAVSSQIEQAKRQQGWDQPLAVQATRFFWKLFTAGDLGRSFQTDEPVNQLLLSRFAATVELTCAAMLLAIPLGMGLGIAAAVWQGKWPDYLCTSVSLIGVSVPVFFLGLCLMLIFSGMPTGRRLPIGLGVDYPSELIVLESLLRGQWQVTYEALRHLLLPAVALASIPTAYLARITRSSLLDVLQADYIRTARAKGNSAWRVILRHALPNASIPIVNIAGLQLGSLLSGAVLTESVFSWPGLGRQLVESVTARDYSVVQGGALLVATVFVLLNVAVDLAYVALDPRVRLESGDGQ